MTLSTSLVAVWYSSDSWRSPVRCAQFAEQPRVLHRDDRLGGEVLQQRDLLVGERPHLLAVDCDDAEQRIILAQGHASMVRAPPRSTIARRCGSPAR